MRALIQRVANAHVDVDGSRVGGIERGLLLLLAVESGDNEAKVSKLVHKVVNYRIFPDQAGKMNLSLLDIKGGILTISQFTLAADTHKGLRPGFSSAASPQDAEHLYNLFLAELRNLPGIQLANGIFAADMQVSLVNDGPVTFLLEA